MAYIAVDKNKDEYIYHTKPSKTEDYWTTYSDCIQLPKGSILKLLGRELTWDDEPVEI